MADKNELIYVFEDGKKIKVKQIKHDRLTELVRKHGFVKIRKVRSI